LKHDLGAAFAKTVSTPGSPATYSSPSPWPKCKATTTVTSLAEETPAQSHLPGSPSWHPRCRTNNVASSTKTTPPELVGEVRSANQSIDNAEQRASNTQLLDEDARRQAVTGSRPAGPNQHLATPETTQTAGPTQPESDPDLG
jgi:hypothetical protein